jgi:hypothetical protein
MSRDTIAVISGKEYRYRYNRDTKEMDYFGPVGEAPPITEEQFRMAMIGRVPGSSDSLQTTIGTGDQLIFTAMSAIDWLRPGQQMELTNDLGLAEGKKESNPEEWFYLNLMQSGQFDNGYEPYEGPVHRPEVIEKFIDDNGARKGKWEKSGLSYWNTFQLYHLNGGTILVGRGLGPSDILVKREDWPRVKSALGQMEWEKLKPRKGL